jgi:hypothetical protein
MDRPGKASHLLTSAGWLTITDTAADNPVPEAIPRVFCLINGLEFRDYGLAMKLESADTTITA